MWMINYLRILLIFLLNKIVYPYIKATNKEYLWFTIRITSPSDLFDIPRWHTDGYFYNYNYYMENKLPQIKLAGTLFGRPTLFKIDNENMLKKYYDIYKKLYREFDYKNFDKIKDKENREIINNILIEYPSHSALKNQAGIFVVGLEDHSAVHSEPPHDTNRLFYSVVSGTKDEIKELASRWNKKFDE